MALLGLELNDTGIMVAGGEPAQLLEVETGERESPGFALTENDHLILGKEAQEKARLSPRLFTNRFWDELSMEPLKQPGLEGKNNAELAYLHFSKIWTAIKKHGDELAIAVPGFFTQRQLGLILGIANELSVPIKGFASTALAASSTPYPHHLLFHLDIHLHQMEIAFLEQSDHLLSKNMKTLSGKGLNYLYSEFVKAIADEFVRTTRFDPFDQALYEQELYTRLPQVLRDLHESPSILFSMKAGSRTYSISLTYDLFAKISEGVFREVYQFIREIVTKYGKSEMEVALQVTHRVSPIPGYRENVHELSNVHIIELEPGASAMGMLGLKDRFPMHTTGQGVTFVSNRPWQTSRVPEDPAIAQLSPDLKHPTHLLYRDLGHPISSKPLIIGQGDVNDPRIHISNQADDVPQKHCAVQLNDDEVVLTNYSTSGTLVDGAHVSEKAVLKRGQTIQVGSPEEELQLITCMGTDET
jgi:hypothetical protein